MRSRTATPHTRGSTLLLQYMQRLMQGYPAYAGIDPLLCFFTGKTPGLPRIRGDRPSGGLHLAVFGAATPHTRGSTVCLFTARFG